MWIQPEGEAPPNGHMDTCETVVKPHHTLIPNGGVKVVHIAISYDD